MRREPMVLLGMPLEPYFVRRPWLVLVLILAAYVVGAFLDGADL